MNYYTKKSKFSFKIKHPKIILVSISILIIFNSIIYFFDKSILPSVLNIGEEKARVEATNIINPILDEYDLIKDEYILDISSKERG